MNHSFFSILLFSFLSCTAQQAISQQKSAAMVMNVIMETNQFRKSNGLIELISKEELNDLAYKHSADMASGRVPFSHEGFEERNKKAGKILTGIKRGFAENVAYGSLTAKEVLNGWEKSAGHRKNMLGNYKYIGVGIAADTKGTFYFTQIFLN